MYSQGLGTEVDYKRAFELYLKSAKQSFPYAEFEVAKMYRDGIGTDFRNSRVNKFIIYLYIFIMSIILIYVQDFYSLKARILSVIPSIILGFLISTVLDILFYKDN